ncbi:MAG: response regulator transcription factor [Ignavibacteriaceae bacterium]|jgi:DNA-binding response OmpR family regulator
MKKILIIEDDPAISSGLVDALEEENFQTMDVDNGEKGFNLAKDGNYDLIILDLRLPGKNGMDVCKDLRREGVNTPIIMVTAKKEELDQVLGLELGADDYVTKPFRLRVLIAKIKAILRRNLEIVSDIEECSFGDVYINFKGQEATKNKNAIELSSLEYKLLKYLCQRENTVIERSTLLDEVWGYENYPSTRTVDNFILSLRKKIEDDPAHPIHLLTVHGAGYKFVK